MIRRLDIWLGLRVFQPPIIWWCQRTGITQWAFHRYAWWIAALWCVWDDDRASTVFTVLLVLGAVLRTFGAGLHLNRPTRSLAFVRFTCIGGAFFILIFGAAGEYSWPQLADQMSWDVLALAAEYAATIRTLPPRPKPAPRGQARPAIA